ncbi:hypothetical protein IGI04_029295 [Brassica rapa subsp. trilocularis]|uniref:PRA1 family protein n=1 Tax=Brassica rapa subsp. trilocularis TaxID=1813537 RepID=A0ABQ7LMF5_BRACM|nr:hypothetical protein IGI04_029295 [Brassica rapa subsp. trilocularis]
MMNYGTIPTSSHPSPPIDLEPNLVYFRANYVIAVLVILFLSLIYHPTSLLVLAILVVFWIFLYFLRDEPLGVFNRQIDDRTVMICLSVLTVVMLLFTHATANVLGAMLTAVVLVLVHAAVRRSDNLFLDEEAVAASEYSGLTSYPSS